MIFVAVVFCKFGRESANFFRVRRINDLTTVDIHTFIFRNIITNDPNVGMATYKAAVSEGKFIFIFDGFDEIAEEKRALVEKQILEIASKSNGNLMIISGRPDERFEAWQKFPIYKVQPLTKIQVSSLIKKATFDETVKSKFLTALSKGLFEKHPKFFVFTAFRTHDASDFSTLCRNTGKNTCLL